MEEIALDRFTGFSELYNKVRPRPPKKIVKLIQDFTNTGKADLIVDLGSGTGLSAVIWKSIAKRLIGIEPNDDMRNEAIKSYKNIDFLKGSSYEMPLNDSSTDIVCCSQSFHWMEPASTLKEVNRILKNDGLFVVYDCNWPVTISAGSEIAYVNLFNQVDIIRKKHEYEIPKETKWPKSNHKNNLINSGYFHYVKETYIENIEKCDAKRFIGIALSQGHIQTLLKNNITDIQEPLNQFISEVEKDILFKRNMYVSYEIIIAKKSSVMTRAATR